MTRNDIWHSEVDFNTNDGLLTEGQRRRILFSVTAAHLLLIAIPVIWMFVEMLFFSRPELMRVTLVESRGSVSDNSVSPPDGSESFESPPLPAEPSPPKDTKPAWKARRAEDITVSRKLAKPSRDPAVTVSSDDIEKRLRERIDRQMHVTGLSPAGTVSAGYYEKVAAYLYRLWNQPTRSELGGARPVTHVRISVTASGAVKSAEISSGSGNISMDKSIEKLLSRLSRLPSPPDGAMQIDVALEIVD